MQHVPGFVSGYNAKKAEASTWGELASVDWIDNYKIHDGKVFYRFSICNDEKRYSLMAEFDNGDYWWVVGDLDQDIPELPRWVYNEGKEIK